MIDEPVDYNGIKGSPRFVHPCRRTTAQLASPSVHLPDSVARKQQLGHRLQITLPFTLPGPETRKPPQTSTRRESDEEMKERK